MNQEISSPVFGVHSELSDAVTDMKTDLESENPDLANSLEPQSFLTDPQNPRRTLEDMQRMIAMLQALDFTECVSEDALMGEHIILGEISRALSDLERQCTIEPIVHKTGSVSVPSQP